MGVKFSKKIGFYEQYYHSVFSHTLYPETFLSTFLSRLNGKVFSCVLSYPVFNKKMKLFDFHCAIVKKTKKTHFLLNQTIFMEGFLSKQKLFVVFPILSFLNKIHF